MSIPLIHSTSKHGEPIPKPNSAPESFWLLVQELRSLLLELDHAIIFGINK